VRDHRRGERGRAGESSETAAIDGDRLGHGIPPERSYA
jgi:hypothetical protein